MHVDTNECLLGTHNCASVAACQNIRGSFICQCPVGYFGDGTQCVGMLNSTDLLMECILVTLDRGHFR
jgi:hypothetical protein